MKSLCSFSHAFITIFFADRHTHTEEVASLSSFLCLGRGGTSARRRGSAALLGVGGLLLCDVTRSGDTPPRGGRLGEGADHGATFQLTVWFCLHACLCMMAHSLRNSIVLGWIRDTLNAMLWQPTLQ